MPDKHTDPEQSGFLKKLRSIFGLNIGTMLFGVLLVYMIFSLVLYLTSTHIESYLVISGPLSRNETYTGLAIREETVHQADSSGYITYYAREGTKINANGVVYGIGSSQSSSSETTLTSSELSQIRDDMMSFSRGFNSSQFNATYNFKYNLAGSILQYGTTTTTSSSSDSDDSEDSDDETDSTTEVTNYGGLSVSKAEEDGIILYSTDGYEGKTVSTLTAEDFDQNSYHETDLKTEGQVSAGDDIYTEITDEKWTLMIPLSDKQAEKLKDRTTVRVKFLKDDMTQSGDFSIVEIDGAKYGQIDFDKGVVRYAGDRFLEIELVTNTVTGLKIPLSSIVTKEFYLIPSKYATRNEDSQEIGFMVQDSSKADTSAMNFVTTTIYDSVEDDSASDSSGSTESSDDSSEDDTTNYIYYVDKKDFKEGDVIVSQKDQSKYVVSDVGVLEGVYCINQGYAVFARIEILDQNEEYAIVSKDTSYGLSRYDHIVKNADKVDEEEILY